MITVSTLQFGDLIFIDNEPFIFMGKCYDHPHGTIFTWYTVLASDGFLEEKSDVALLFATLEPLDLKLYDDTEI